MGKYLKLVGPFFRISVSFFVLWPSKFGSDGVFTRIFGGFKSVQRGRSSDWIVGFIY